jgi:hypothetical protein
LPPGTGSKAAWPDQAIEDFFAIGPTGRSIALPSIASFAAAHQGRGVLIMLFHASIGARDPSHVASVLAALWQGQAYPFPPFPGSFIAFAGDEHGTAIEIYPAGQVLVPGEEEVASSHVKDGMRPTETHLAIGVPRSESEIHEIAKWVGWKSRTCVRGGAFRVVELWVENRLLIEVLTPEMRQEYRAVAKPEIWEEFLRSVECGGTSSLPALRERASAQA